MIKISQISVYDNKNLSDYWLEKIAVLKKQYWPYPLKEQIRYIKDLPRSDLHFILWQDGLLLGYLRLTARSGKAGRETLAVAGISTVCVDKKYRGKGFGRAMIKEVNGFMTRKHFDLGLLLCPEDYAGFYEQCGWVKSTCCFFTRTSKNEKVPVKKDGQLTMIYPCGELPDRDVDLRGDLF